MAEDNIILLDGDSDLEETHISVSNFCLASENVRATPVLNIVTVPAVAQEKSSEKDAEKVILKAQNEKLFAEFVEFCSKLSDGHPEVISFLKGRHEKARPEYLASTEFRNVIGRCLTRVQNKKGKVFVYINEVCTALKANSQKKKVPILRVETISEPSESRVAKDVQASTSEPAEGKASELQGPSTCLSEPQQEVKKRKSGSKRQIRYLENLLKVYTDEIRRLQEKELDLNELENEDSIYIQESRLKRKLVKIFDKLCELKNCSNLTGRVIEQRITYRGTRYPEINRKLEKFINKLKDFPDYQDVLKMIRKVNASHELGLGQKQMQRLAQDAFHEVGNRLQERRHLDLIYNFGSHLTDNYKPASDPAIIDSSLARRLRENRTTALSQLDDVIKKYAVMQDVGEEEERKKRQKKESLVTSTSNGSKEGSEKPSEKDTVEGDSGNLLTTGGDAEREATPEEAEEEEIDDAEEEEEDDDEEEEDDVSSDPDIDDELQKSQQVADLEEEEPEDEGKADGSDLDQETDDQKSQVEGSSGGDEEEDEDSGNDNELFDKEDKLDQVQEVELENTTSSLDSIKESESEQEISSETAVAPLDKGHKEELVQEVESLSSPAPESPQIQPTSDKSAFCYFPERSPKHGASELEEESVQLSRDPVISFPAERKRRIDFLEKRKYSDSTSEEQGVTSPQKLMLKTVGVGSLSVNGRDNDDVSESSYAAKKVKKEHFDPDSKVTLLDDGTPIEEDKLDISLDLQMTCVDSPDSPIPTVDSTRSDSPFTSVVTSSQPSPRQRYSIMKVNAATQCDPEEVIVLSDSE
ncbi:death domain-associated protein 6 [Latimeria chalumnae]|uniref:death domain-associated protein 6 n=1 Tax=Latimeria chalumnae TaxID=7897 RepID=UPI0003C17152|nr:PREDICTED: death domain-associated protein 6 [Latimeria chalumnae]XP_006000989.1 PREDICTED: death domain-associated protein 6 [Latimeria chalumnae]XP_006000990.1 PREDICTED: death domain-associated protein 6 [Latimeria chalumnae]XP_014346883.1 PREDICTED: death domain-associated protein 6 [Latimeria chalumnae]XP_014346884.1 PREDICTED: death domain-associated protein 6 [Latimeria chalumnae]|eukprot:XP_006000988.1 PREDICTED: death domain-associated protein 6 [Latimeria chalumnae]